MRGSRVYINDEFVSKEMLIRNRPSVRPSIHGGIFSKALPAAAAALLILLLCVPSVCILSSAWPTASTDFVYPLLLKLAIISTRVYLCTLASLDGIDVNDRARVLEN